MRVFEPAQDIGFAELARTQLDHNLPTPERAVPGKVDASERTLAKHATQNKAAKNGAGLRPRDRGLLLQPLGHALDSLVSPDRPRQRLAHDRKTLTISADIGLLPALAPRKKAS